MIGKYNFKDVSKICLHLFLSFCLLWICIFMKDIWYKCKYQSCFQLFYPVLIREILQIFFLVEMYLTFALQYLSKLDPTVKMVSNGKILWHPKAMPAPFETEEDQKEVIHCSVIWMVRQTRRRNPNYKRKIIWMAD